MTWSGRTTSSTLPDDCWQTRQPPDERVGCRAATLPVPRQQSPDLPSHSLCFCRSFSLVTPSFLFIASLASSPSFQLVLTNSSAHSLAHASSRVVFCSNDLEHDTVNKLATCFLTAFQDFQDERKSQYNHLGLNSRLGFSEGSDRVIHPFRNLALRLHSEVSHYFPQHRSDLLDQNGEPIFKKLQTLQLCATAVSAIINHVWLVPPLKLLSGDSILLTRPTGRQPDSRPKSANCG